MSAVVAFALENRQSASHPSPIFPCPTAHPIRYSVSRATSLTRCTQSMPHPLPAIYGRWRVADRLQTSSGNLIRGHNGWQRHHAAPNAAGGLHTILKRGS